MNNAVIEATRNAGRASCTPKRSVRTKVDNRSRRITKYTNKVKLMPMK